MILHQIQRCLVGLSRVGWNVLALQKWIGTNVERVPCYHFTLNVLDLITIYSLYFSVETCACVCICGHGVGCGEP